MTNIIFDRRLLTIVVIPSFLWLFVCATYISGYVGWDNMFASLPHEIAAIILSIVTPVVLFAILFIAFSKGTENDGLGDDVRLQGSLIENLSTKIDNVIEVMLENRESHIAGIENITDKLTSALRSEEEKAGKIGPADISQQTALLGLLNVVLNDINVSVTRLLVRLMEKEGRSKEEAKEFIQGLVNAYSVGDRDVFFAVLRHQLANNPERIVSLQALSSEFPNVSRDLSKIIRESTEIVSLIGRFDDDDIIRVLFDDTALRTLSEVLEPHFNENGISKAPLAGGGEEEKSVEEEESAEEEEETYPADGEDVT